MNAVCPRYKTSVFVLMSLTLAGYHVARKPLSVVKVGKEPIGLQSLLRQNLITFS